MTRSGANNGDPQDYVARVEHCLNEIENLRADCVAKCKDIRADIKMIYMDARNAGLDVKPLKSIVKYRALEAKQQAIFEQLDDNEREIYEALIDTMGDLGRAAARRAGYSQVEAPLA